MTVQRDDERERVEKMYLTNKVLYEYIYKWEKNLNY